MGTSATGVVGVQDRDIEGFRVTSQHIAERKQGSIFFFSLVERDLALAADFANAPRQAQSRRGSLRGKMAFHYITSLLLHNTYIHCAYSIMHTSV